MQKLQLTFNKIYQTRTIIGQSPTSTIYLGINTNTDKEVAIKLQKKNINKNRIQHQAKAYKILNNQIGIPTLYWYGNQHNYNVLVIDVLGPSLGQLFKYCQYRFSLKTVLMIADQILDRLECLHGKNFIYKDIKPQNFLIGLREKADKIFIIDFELIQRYVDEDNNHNRLKKSTSNRFGNEIFLSINGHLGIQQSRRDDLQSLGYMLVYFLKGKLPWEEIDVEDDIKRNLLIKEKKVEIPIQKLCSGIPKQFIDYFNYVRSLQFEQQPDYVWIKRLFKDLLIESGQQMNLIFDWGQKHHDQ